MSKETTIDRKSPPIAVTYQDDLGAEAAVSDFETAIKSTGVEVQTESHGPRGPFAGVEWLLPTAIVVLIAKPYFDGFLREAGEDHYHILKNAIARLAERFTGANAPNVKLVYTKGKTKSPEPNYSLVFSVYGQITSESRLKLLVKPDSSSEELRRAISAFVDALLSLHDRSSSTGDVIGLEDAKSHGGTILVTFVAEENRLRVVDPW